METGMSNYMADGHDGVTATWDLVQDNLKCCCVGGTVKDCGKQSQDTSKFNNKGCFKTFTDFFRDNLNYVGVTAFCVAAAEVVVISLACCLGKKMGIKAEYV